MKRSTVTSPIKPLLVLLVAACSQMTTPEPAEKDPTASSHVPPIFVDGNPTCAALGYGDFELRVEPVSSGTYTDPNTGFSVEIDVYQGSNGQEFDWTSNYDVNAVFVKGGPGGNLYVYEPPAQADTGLHAPMAPSGQWHGLSHISFCYSINLIVQKDAHTSLTRTHEWEIEKTVDPDTHVLQTGESGTSTYTVTVTKTGFTDSDFAVTGTITIMNPSSMADATITGVTDVISPAIEATVDCGVTFPYLLAAGDTLTCTYSAALPDDESRINTVTVTTEGPIGGGEATANVDFSNADINELNDTINVDDTNGMSWTTSDSASWTYERTFTCDEDEGEHPNTATIRETEQSDDALVTVECIPPPAGDEGCTPGYWKNHPESWEATGYSLSDMFFTVFAGITNQQGLSASLTLVQAVNLGGGGFRKLARHAVAALLNAAHPDVNYYLSVDALIAAVVAAFESGNAEPLATELVAANEAGCPLN